MPNRATKHVGLYRQTPGSITIDITIVLIGRVLPFDTWEIDDVARRGQDIGAGLPGPDQIYICSIGADGVQYLSHLFEDGQENLLMVLQTIQPTLVGQ